MSDPTIDALAAKLKRTELQHKSSSIPGREIVQVLTEIPAGVESGWHQHPGEEVGYILAGTVEMMIKEQPALTLQGRPLPDTAANTAQRARPRPRDRNDAQHLHRRDRRADRRVHRLTGGTGITPRPGCAVLRI